jgi:hypothetical protein
MMTFVLTCLAAGFAVAAAIAWFISTQTISREQELERRRKAAKPGETVNLGGVDIVDGESKYDLIATLRHQGKWNRWGAGFAAAAAVCQAMTLMPLT